MSDAQGSAQAVLLKAWMADVRRIAGPSTHEIAQCPAPPAQLTRDDCAAAGFRIQGSMSARYHSDVLGEFLVRKKIRFPAGLHGAHLVRFRIQKGTPMPEGDPGHSCVIVEGTGMPLYNGATCDGPFGLKR